MEQMILGIDAACRPSSAHLSGRHAGQLSIPVKS